MADLRRGAGAGGRRRTGDPIDPRGRELAPVERLAGAHGNGPAGCVDPNDVEWDGGRDAKPLTLAHGEPMDAGVLPHDLARNSPDRPSPGAHAVRLEKARVVAVGHEADLMTVGLVGDGEVQG